MYAYLWLAFHIPIETKTIPRFQLPTLAVPNNSAHFSQKFLQFLTLTCLCFCLLFYSNPHSFDLMHAELFFLYLTAKIRLWWLTLSVSVHVQTLFFSITLINSKLFTKKSDSVAIRFEITASSYNFLAISSLIILQVNLKIGSKL